MTTYEPTSIEDAINRLQEFLESDLWSKFHDAKIKGEVWVREDKFKEEKDLWEYLDEHFNILIKEIRELKEKKLNELNKK